MSASAAPDRDDARFARLPPWLRPRSSEDPGLGQLRLIETTVLVLVGLILLIATVNDLSRQATVNKRLVADLQTWRAYTGHNYHSVSIDQELLGSQTKREVVCGNTAPGAPKATTQICLVIWGPQVGGKRTIHGGWMLPPKAEDERALRYGCFGDEYVRSLCPG